MAARASVGASLSNKNFDDRHQEYLRKLQARNLQQKLVREAEENRNADRLRREQGFSVYLSGANQRKTTSLERQRSPSIDAAFRQAARQWEENTVEIRGVGGEVHALRPSGERRFLPPRLPAIPAAAGLVLGSSSTSVATLKQTADCTLRSPSLPARFGSVMRLEAEEGEATLHAGASPKSARAATLTATQRELQGLLPSLVSAGVVGTGTAKDRLPLAASALEGFDPPSRSEVVTGAEDDASAYGAGHAATSSIKENAGSTCNSVASQVEEDRTARSARELDVIPSPLPSPLDKALFEFTADEYDVADLLEAHGRLADEQDTSTGFSEGSEVSEHLAITAQLEDEHAPVESEADEEASDSENEQVEVPAPEEEPPFSEDETPERSDGADPAPAEVQSPVQEREAEDAAVVDDNDPPSQSEAKAEEAYCDQVEGLAVTCELTEALKDKAEGSCDEDPLPPQSPHGSCASEHNDSDNPDASMGCSSDAPGRHDSDHTVLVEEEDVARRIQALSPEWQAAFLRLLKEAEAGHPVPAFDSPTHAS
mmetsp:Transcript_2087/g.3528  ORF Transcript_2087/g.3528 Transcript_2087/m.3528 type:complete len:542 (+) Transcript_2087:70-1695(+)